MECPACHTPNIDGARFCAKCGALLPATPTEDEADPNLGTIVGGRFRITAILGEGGMGRVYTGEQQMGTSVRKVAIKMLLAQYAKDPQVVARFMRECGTVSELEHPNTIKVYDFGPTPTNDLYIAMELLTGASLEKVLESGALPPERVDRILSQVCGSLQEAHDKGIVHRDLKPANIYLTTRAGEEDYVKVLDFGIAKRDDKHSKAEAKLTQQGTVLGTPPYMSPEQFKGQELDARSDIYSLGVMSYEMLTGRLPFDADTPWAWATQHMTAQPFPFETVPIGSAVPPKMKAGVMRALSKDKALRPQTVKDFYEDFTLGGGRTSGLGRASVVDPGLAASWVPGSAPGAGPITGAAPLTGAGSRTEISGIASAPGVYPSSPGMAVPAGGYSTGPQVPLPPPPVPRKSNAGLVLGVVAVLGIVGVGGGVVLLKGRGRAGNDSADAGARPATTTAASPAVTATTPPEPKPAPDEDAGPASAPDAGPHITHPIGVSLGDPHSDACHHAETAAMHDNVPEARRLFASCEGPAKPAAHAAIEQAEQRLRHLQPPPPPCRGRHCPH
jgi:serine/threonine-protein kinase